METRRALLVDAFSAEPLSGNAAGVVPDAEGLSDEQMRAIAGELRASETAFLLPSEAADRRLRYFTPTEEVKLCGHATVAAHAWLAEEGRLEAGAHTVETNAGVSELELDGDTVWLAGDVAETEEVDPGYERVASALGVDPATLADIGADLPLATASTGLGFLVVPVNFLSALSGASPDPEALTALTDSLGVAGVYAFTFDTLGEDATAHGRMFAPGIGIEEDPVTGTASGAVGAYLRAFEAFDGGLPAEMVLEQGHFLERPGRVRVRARSDPVSVGGTAVTALDGTIAVPDRGSDGIIEV
ncbi:PhzF family phenazine biosynthesis protein [Natronomonas sp.]|uniref:PhzF family phenazine biosynthesis protein n=1 Tax=Natronomonas sp. TaxID=2184060 RepID=UPI002613EE4A|nr:PhzF family phenazine biosynthesis protein [Natronomonas sp.]